MNELELKDYDYELPTNKIALHPANNRADSKLLVFDKGKIIHSKFNEIANFIPTDALIVLNTTKVLPARIKIKRKSGSVVEFLLLEPANEKIDYQLAALATQEVEFRCIIGGRNIKEGDVFIKELNIKNRNISLEISVLKRYDNKADIRFYWETNDLTFSQLLTEIGALPLPPYIKRDLIAADNMDYQTIYGINEGSVAAPTAGLHFTPKLLEDIKTKYKVIDLVLHIGIGTFVPIKESIDKHIMHTERIGISKESILTLLEQYTAKKPVIATGTTTLRTLESLYWFGLDLINGLGIGNYKKNNGFCIKQEDIYKEKKEVSVEKSFSAIVDFMETNGLEKIEGRTGIFIVPDYKIRTIDGLITNFHLPKSTLLLLVSAFIGLDNVKQVYREALSCGYRFLSYGDVSLLVRGG